MGFGVWVGGEFCRNHEIILFFVFDLLLMHVPMEVLYGQTTVRSLQEVYAPCSINQQEAVDKENST
jgi:hypothetical protein